MFFYLLVLLAVLWLTYERLWDMEGVRLFVRYILVRVENYWQEFIKWVKQ